MDYWKILKSTTRLIISLFTILILVLIFGASSQVRAHTSPSDGVVIIHVDETGFSPNQVNIPLGTEIIFENVGVEDHWPASDDHPSHTLYDGTSLSEHCAEGHISFDACQGISSGESWSFTFAQTGTYAFHDHLWPHLGGEIVVTQEEDTPGSQKMLASILEYFKKLFSGLDDFFNRLTHSKIEDGNIRTETYEELKARYSSLVLTSDPGQAISQLETESLDSSQTSAYCHDLLHVIGRTAYSKYGSFAPAAKYQNDFCNSGYVHGLFEVYFQNSPDALNNLTLLCEEYAADRPFDLWQCYHGVGHGLMYLTGGDLDLSLKLCQDSLEGESERDCQNGVYMEVFNLEILAKEVAAVNPDDPFFTCSSRTTDKSDCYLYVPTYLSQTLGQSYEEIFVSCHTVESDFVSLCVSGVGAEAVKRNINNLKEVFAICQQAPSESDQISCVQGLVRTYLSQTGSYISGQSLCGQAPPEYLSLCANEVQLERDFLQSQ